MAEPMPCFRQASLPTIQCLHQMPSGERIDGGITQLQLSPECFILGIKSPAHPSQSGPCPEKRNATRGAPSTGPAIFTGTSSRPAAHPARFSAASPRSQTTVTRRNRSAFLVVAALKQRLARSSGASDSRRLHASANRCSDSGEAAERNSGDGEPARSVLGSTFTGAPHA